MDQYSMSDSIRSSVFFDWRCRPGVVSPAVWVYDIKRSVQSRATSGILSYGLGLRNCSPIARDQDLGACKRLEICLVGSANDVDKALLLPGPNLRVDLTKPQGNNDGPGAPLGSLDTPEESHPQCAFRSLFQPKIINLQSHVILGINRCAR